ncbi:putative nucleoside diphosphate kinase [Dictyocaulus viviparus]|uniref:Nucleoside diphosphate kinase n=1 Tax=Dictyocaulus viviparus TaxID=29172 RepID=A0A0D8XCH4_DICVI|nr:putative nucleoside diphosphate kinase [Dictyocaulus viviparus]
MVRDIIRECPFHVYGDSIGPAPRKMYPAILRLVLGSAALVYCNVCDRDSCAGMSVNERTFIAVKPDGVHRNLVGKIIQRFEDRGYKLVALKMVTASKQHLEVHYKDLKDKPFFPHLIQYMGSGPVVAMVWQGLDVVKQGRSMLGATNPLASAPGTIRGDFCIQTGRNICHGSDSVESAQREIAHWFKPEEINDYESPFIKSWVYE